MNFTQIGSPPTFQTEFNNPIVKHWLKQIWQYLKDFASTNITDFTEAVQDTAGAMVTGNTETGITVTYQDTDGTIDFELSDEYIQDLAGAMVSGNTETGITVTYQDTDGTLDFALSDEYIQDVVGAMVTGNTETGITVTYQDGDGTIDFVLDSDIVTLADTQTLTNKTLTDPDINGGTVDVDVGGSTSTDAVGCTVNVNTTVVGNVGGGTDNLMSYTLPASALSVNGHTIEVIAFGSTANNANAKTLTFNFGTKTLATSLTTGAANNWYARIFITRTGANTQDINFVLTEANTGLDTTTAHKLVAGSTSTETNTSAITIKFTAAATTTNDITQEFMLVRFLN